MNHTALSYLFAIVLVMNSEPEISLEGFSENLAFTPVSWILEEVILVQSDKDIHFSGQSQRKLLE